MIGAPEPHLRGFVRILAQKPVDSPPYAILRIAPISEKNTVSTFFAASCCNRAKAMLNPPRRLLVKAAHARFAREEVSADTRATALEVETRCDTVQNSPTPLAFHSIEHRSHAYENPGGPGAKPPGFCVCAGRRAPGSRIKANSPITSSASAVSRRDSSASPQESPKRTQVSPRTQPASPLGFIHDRGASRPSFAGGEDRSDRPAPTGVERCRRAPRSAGNASFSGLAPIAQLPAALELPGDWGGLLRHSP
jgi:hypothetical protein